MPQSAPPSRWLPLLEARDAERALAVAAEIADALFALATPLVPEAPRRHFSLPELAGWTLLLAYLDRAAPGYGHGERATELLDSAIEGMGSSYAPWSLYSGFPGLAWVVEHLKGWLIDGEDEDGEDPGEEIAVSLRDHLGMSPWRGDHDLISGLAGLGVYALERLPRPWGKECLESVVARLAEKAERRPEGTTWRTVPEALIPQVAEIFPQGNWDLGVAHGVPGVIAVLAQACAEGLEDCARPLLDGAVAWTLAQRLPPGERSIFPHVVAPDRLPGPSRLAWCYGDLGVAVTLLLAARTVGEPDWEREALAAARACARRPPETSGVVDAGFCHGAAGNAHLFNRIFQATGDPLFADAARHWLERTLEMKRPGEGTAGWVSWDPGDVTRGGWQADPSFLGGAAGIGLALLAAASPVEPDWDRLLLVSVPPRNQ
jgi:hypothetical protein